MTLFRKVFQHQSRPAKEDERIDEDALRAAFMEMDEAAHPLMLDPFEHSVTPTGYAGLPKSGDPEDDVCVTPGDVAPHAVASDSNGSKEQSEQIGDPTARGADPVPTDLSSSDDDNANNLSLASSAPDFGTCAAAVCGANETHSDAGNRHEETAPVGFANLAPASEDSVPAPAVDDLQQMADDTQVTSAAGSIADEDMVMLQLVAKAHGAPEDTTAEPKSVAENDAPASPAEPGATEAGQPDHRDDDGALGAGSPSTETPREDAKVGVDGLSRTSAVVDLSLSSVSEAATGRSSRRAGRVKTRLLGFNRGAETENNPFDQTHATTATPQRERFPVGWLVIVEGPGLGHAFSLFAGASMIGRGEDQVIRLDFGDLSISRQNHAAIAYDEEQNKFYLGHGGKSNIIRRNARPVLSTEELHHADLIRIGETTLRFVALCGSDFKWHDAEVHHDATI